MLFRSDKDEIWRKAGLWNPTNEYKECAAAIRARGKQEIWPFPRKVIFDDHIMPKFNPDNEEDALL